MFAGPLRDERFLGADRVTAVLAELNCLERPRVGDRLCVANKLSFDADELRSQLI